MGNEINNHLGRLAEAHKKNDSFLISILKALLRLLVRENPPWPPLK